MADATRTVKVKFDGQARGLARAAKQGENAMQSFERQAKRTMGSLDLGGGIVDALGALPSQLKGIAIVAGVAFGAAFAPAAASAIISGLLLAVGGAGLAAGIIGAARHPKVKSAWKKFADQAGKTFERFSAPFVQPMIRAANTFRLALRRAEPTIIAIGRTLAPVIDKLGPGLAAMAERALPGILAAAQASVPLFSTLAGHMPKLGDAVAGFFSRIADGMPSAQAFFDKFLGWVENLLPKLGGFVTWLSDLGTKMDEFSKGPQFIALKDALTKLKDDTLAGVKAGFDSIKISVGANSETWRNLAKDIEGAIKVLGPIVKWFANLVGDSIAAAIDWFATLYDAIRKVVIIVKELITGASRLPGNLSGGNVHVERGRIPGRAYGGPVTAGRSYLVGERGVPELFTPDQSGRVTPLEQVGLASGGSNVEVRVYIGDQELRGIVRTEVSETNRSLRRRVLAGAGAR